ncbi:MAG: glycoside hydrolase family 3 N-terminal domain-containing protein [Caldilineaceae bacterium]
MAAVGTGAGLCSGCVTPPVALVANSVQAGHGITPRALPPLPAGSPYAAPMPPLDVKIGQMLMVGFRGVSAPENSAIVRTIREQHVGAVVLFEYNISPSLQASATLRNLTGALQTAALQVAEIPLLIAIDQEGGQVTRLREAYGFPRTVSAGYLGALNDVDATYSFADAMASSLADHGVNLNLAPVVDVNVNPRNPVIGAYERSFSADPETVTTQATAFVRAHHDHGVLCTLKHFPGHGSSTGDTHLGFVDVTDRWSEAELTPYRRFIERNDGRHHDGAHLQRQARSRAAGHAVAAHHHRVAARTTGLPRRGHLRRHADAGHQQVLRLRTRGAGRGVGRGRHLGHRQQPHVQR